MDFDEEFQIALGFRDRGDLCAARDALLTLAKRKTDSAALFAVLGKVRWDLGELDSAVKSFREAARVSPKSEIASLGIFHCLWEQGKQGEAIEEAKRFLRDSESENYKEILANIE